MRYFDTAKCLWLSRPIALAGDDGHWVTIDGEHVHIGKGGEIDKGPKGLVGKSVAGAAKPVSVGDRVTLPSYTGAAGDGKNYGRVDGTVISATPKSVTVRTINTPEMAAMFGPHTDTKIPREVAEKAANSKALSRAFDSATLKWVMRPVVAAPAKVAPVSKVFLSMAVETKATLIPLALAGYKTHKTYMLGDQEKTEPISYWWKSAIKSGDYQHPKTGQKFSVTPSTIDQWVKNFRLMRDAGTEVPVPVDHSFKAEDNRGWVEEMRRDGDTLQVLHALIGEDAAKLALRNRCSVYIDPAYRDERGKEWGTTIVHSALTPVPVIGGMGEFIPVQN